MTNSKDARVRGFKEWMTYPHAILHSMDPRTIAEELASYDFIIFAFIFGSCAEGKATRVSDIDIAIYTKRDISLLEMGEIVSHLEKTISSKVDLLILNDLYRRKPALAFEIVSKGHLLFCHDRERFVEFKKNTFLRYFDTAPLRTLIDKRFMQRVAEGRTGRRNYVGAA